MAFNTRTDERKHTDENMQVTRCMGVYMWVGGGGALFDVPAADQTQRHRRTPLSCGVLFFR